MTERQTIMSLGEFEFRILENSFDSIKYRKEYIWARRRSLGQKSTSKQFIGEESPQVSLSGVIYTPRAGAGGLTTRQRLEEEAAKGTPLFLLDSSGFSLGKWIIKSIESDEGWLTKEGLPKKITYKVEIEHYEGNAWKYM